MLSTTNQLHDTADLAQIIEHQIMNGTWGRIHRLDVELLNDRVIVHGRTASYYTKQLALQAVLEVIGVGSGPEVDLDIEVA